MTTTLHIPSITRKKPVLGHEKPNSFRVLGDVVDTTSYAPPQPTKDVDIRDFNTTLPLPSWRDGDAREALRNIRYRGHCSVSFLRKNVRNMNDPVGVVPTVTDEGHWWPSHVPRGAKPEPPHTLDTTARESFRWPLDDSRSANARHGARPPVLPALGIVPVNALPSADGSPRFHKETMSYEHQYDSRSGDNYPLRARRHGAFVYESLPRSDAERLAVRPDWQVVGAREPAPESSAPDGAPLPPVLAAAPSAGARRRSTAVRSELAPRSNLNVRVRHD